jgi:hypothetical protein
MFSGNREDEGSTSSSVLLIHFQKSRLLWTSASVISRTSDGGSTGATKAASCISIAAPESGFGESSVASVGTVSGDELSDVVAVVDKLYVNAVAAFSTSEAEAEFLKCRQASEYDIGTSPAATSSFPQRLAQCFLQNLCRVKLITILLVMRHAYSRAGIRTFSHKDGIRILLAHERVFLPAYVVYNNQTE